MLARLLPLTSLRGISEEDCNKIRRLIGCSDPEELFNSIIVPQLAIFGKNPDVAVRPLMILTWTLPAMRCVFCEAWCFGVDTVVLLSTVVCWDPLFFSLPEVDPIEATVAGIAVLSEDGEENHHIIGKSPYNAITVLLENGEEKHEHVQLRVTANNSAFHSWGHGPNGGVPPGTSDFVYTF